jgi:RimJ/RimL family protein N-acetyltransferase
VIRFRPLEESDLPQVEAWLRTEYVAEWWRDPLEIAVEKRQAALEGRRDVDLFVRDPAAVGRGLGPGILQEFARSVVFACPETTALVATVEEPNRRSWRAFEKASVRHVRDVEEDGLPHRLMRLERRYAH